MTFKWCEKQSEECKSPWLQDANYKSRDVERKLLDGYGISEDRGIAVMVESSGAESNVVHSVEDSIKQIKNATDFLSYLKVRFRNASAITFTKLKVPTLLLIRNQLTMTVTSLDYTGRWQVIDIRTATVPTRKEGRFDLFKLFELLAKLKEVWDEQQQVVMTLGAEAAGVTEPFEETVADHVS